MAGALTVLLVTLDGPYVSPDAVSYIGTARGLAAGDGFTAPPGTPPVGHFAPLFPAVLGALDVVGIDPLDGARWLNAALLGATVLAVGLVLRRVTGDWWPGVAGAVLVVGAADVLAYHSAALSEPMFALLALLALVALARYVEERRVVVLGASTALTALALLTRYVGVALVVAGAVALVVYGARRMWHGLLEAAVFSFAAVVPVGAWVLWARGAHGAGSEGDVVFHSFGAHYVERGAANVLEWIGPGWPWWLALGAAAGALGLLVWALRSSPTDSARAPRRPLPAVCAIFAGGYVVVLLLDRLLLDASALLDRRLLLPLHLVAIVGLLALVRPRSWRDPARMATAALVSLLVLVQWGDAVGWVADAVDNGRAGYGAPAWRNSTVLASVTRLSPDVTVYTNGPDAIWFVTGRATTMLPARKDYLTGEPNPRYGAELAEMASQLRAGRGAVVYFPPIQSRPFLPTVAELERAVPLHAAQSDAVATLYQAPP